MNKNLRLFIFLLKKFKYNYNVKCHMYALNYYRVLFLNVTESIHSYINNVRL